ncbi:MAG: hypothetical protein EXR95_01220 [Gemmatimonadetes bacterium]|nr:hypothetical protein [Gemmatimonadota bacterium]
MSNVEMWAALGAVVVIFLRVFGGMPKWRQLRRDLPAVAAAAGYNVTIEGGHGGTVTYREDAGEHAFGWELAGRGPSVAFIYMPDEARWPVELPWAVGRRAEILERVAGEVHRQTCRGCRVEIGATVIEFFER